MHEERSDIFTRIEILLLCNIDILKNGISAIMLEYKLGRFNLLHTTRKEMTF